MHLKSIFKSRFDEEAGKTNRSKILFVAMPAYGKFLFLFLFLSSFHLKAVCNPGTLENGPARGHLFPDFNAFTISGTVTDQATGKAVEGATVRVKGESTATVTDASGAFSITVKSAKAILVITSVGFQSVERAVDATTGTLKIALESDQKAMGEVIVTALGIQRSVKSLTYSAQKIGGDQINEMRDANFTNTLSGKVAGLSITSSAGGPGSATRVLLRGNRSIASSNNALFVVDGVAIDNSTPVKQVTDDAGSNGGGHSGSDGVSNINPDDIESISVLKGAAGSVLYGSRAANGVIIITTKKGKAGKISVNINSGVTMDKAMLLPDFQNTYGQGAGGDFSINTGNSWGPKIAGQTITDWTGNSTKLTAYPDNFKDFFRTGVSTNNGVSMSAATDKIQSYLSYTNTASSGIVEYNHLMRHTFNARVGYNITSRLSADAKVTYTLQNIYDKPGIGGDGMVAANIYRIPRSVNLQDVKHYQDVDVTGIETPTYWTSKDPVYMNPYWTINNTHRDEGRSRLTGLISLKYKLTDWLNLQGRLSNDSYNDYITQKYANNTVNYARKPGGYYAEGTDYVSERNADVLLTGNNKISSAFKVNYNIGASVLTRGLRHRNIMADGLAFPNKYDLSYASSALKTEAVTYKRDLQSVYGTAQISYNDYLYLDVAARNDWASTLPSPYSYFYPSVGLSWVLSDMTKMPDWISYAKVRGSVAKVGNDADPYMLSQTYSYIAGGFGGYIGSSNTKLISDLKPELTTSLELGTEWRFFKNRLGIDLSYYKTNSKNQLFKVNTPSPSGYSFAYINAGNVENKGVELMLTAKPIVGSGLNWDVSLNFAKNTNKIIELFPGSSILPLGTSANVRTAIPVVTVGGSYGDLYGYKWLRSNGQYVVDATGAPVKGTAIEKIGNFNPDFSLALGNTFTYKNLSLSVLVDGKFGGEIASGSAGQTAYAGTAAITAKYRDAGSLLLPGVLADGTKNATPINAEKLWQTVAQGDYNWAEFFTFDATTVRVRELSLGYEFKNLPSAFKAIKLSLVARNLFFLYRGSSILDIPGIGKRKMDFDPEVSFGNSNYQGIEYYNLPSTRSIGLNLKLTF